MSDVYLRIRDCFMNGGCEYVVDRVSESSARGQPLSYETIQVLRRSKRTGLRRLKSVRRKAGNDNFAVAARIEDSCITRRMSVEEFENFLAQRNKPEGAASESEEGQQQSQSTERSDSMASKATAKKKDANQNEKPTQGRAAYIHELKEKGKKMAEAMPLVQEKFNCPEGLFKKIWNRDARGEGEAAKPAPKKKTSGSTKKKPGAGAKSPTPPAPPVEKSPTPPPPPASDTQAES